MSTTIDLFFKSTKQTSPGSIDEGMVKSNSYYISWGAKREQKRKIFLIILSISE